MPRQALALLALGAALAACARPAPTEERDVGTSPPNPAAPAEPPAPELAPRIGLGDPDHPPFVLGEAPPPLVSQAPPTAARYAGTITASPSVLGVFAQGETRRVRVHLRASGKRGVPAGIRVLRVAGLAGVAAGFEPSFDVWDPAYGLGDLARDTIALPFRALRAVHRAVTDPPAPDTPFSLDMPAGHDAYAGLRVVVPLDAPLGRHEGRIEVEGNFAATSFLIELTVVPFGERIAASIARLGAPGDALPVAAMVPRRAGSDPPVQVPVPLHATPVAEGGWERWLPAGGGIWDLGAAEWIGPITVDAERPVRAKMLAGPRDAPRLFVLNAPSIDVLDIRTRTTTARLVPQHGGSQGRAFARLRAVSPDGDRVLASTGGHMELWTREGDAWRAKVVDDAAFGTAGSDWVSVDPELRVALAGVHPKGAIAGWDEVVRRDLATGQRASVSLPTCELWAFGRGLVVGLVSADGSAPPIALRVVRMDDLSVRKVSLPPIGDRVTRLVVDELSGDVFAATFVHGCIALSGATLERRPCAQMPPEEPAVPGTAIHYRLASEGVSYTR